MVMESDEVWHPGDQGKKNGESGKKIRRAKSKELKDKGQVLRIGDKNHRRRQDTRKEIWTPKQGEKDRKEGGHETSRSKYIKLEFQSPPGFLVCRALARFAHKFVRFVHRV